MTALAMLAEAVSRWCICAWTHADWLLVRASIPAWMICLACLSPAVWRIGTRRPRSLDPVWGVVFLLAINRLSFLIHISLILSHATALLLALTMAWFSLWYQRHDRELVR